MRKHTHFLRNFTALIVATGLASLSTAVFSKSLPEMELYLKENCSCCSLWAEHVEKAGFSVELNYVDDDELKELKEEHGLGPGTAISACHTAFVGGYVIEGHVPAEQIKALLTEEPEVKGLVVPGMPMGSPGMDMGEHKEDYEVLAFDEDGDTYTFASYEH